MLEEEFTPTASAEDCLSSSYKLCGFIFLERATKENT